MSKTPAAPEDTALTVERRRLELGGTFLSYVDTGEGPPIVLLPGYAGSILNFSPQLDGLADTHRVIAFDQIGHGGSDRPAMDYRPADYVRFARRFLEKLDCGPATLVGNSMGGSIAYALAIDHPGLVESIALIAPRPPVIATESRTRRAGTYLLRRFPGSAERSMAFAMRAFLPFVAHQDPDNCPPELAEAIDAERRGLFRAKGYRHVLVKTAAHIDEWSGWSGRLREIGHPVLLVWGSRDKAIPVENAYVFTKEIPQIETLILDGAGHLAMIERADEVNEAIRGFLATGRDQRTTK